ncbi:hypothetical protein FHU38_002299 [Saccharomonospora amisosensis]|uniref:DUF3040 domain-containing protein n=1 Tax=Saccharomonospora amisosensis TaxID=1128677 RepID=A0A7X5UPU9_9PSEU|nr:DUF3040 domain-containing protein [Saccharomonospora amisosensis]NIJ11955.1 hypothetical protein [Saccharomonospora amisosensis]
MPLNEQERHVLFELERNLRTEDPRLAHVLANVSRTEHTTSVWLTLMILAAVGAGLALLVFGWVLPGLLVIGAGTAGPVLWASRRYYHPDCHHVVSSAQDHCPRCTPSPA